MAFKVLFAIAAYYDLDIDQMDVKTAFFYGLIDQLVYKYQNAQSHWPTKEWSANY